MQSALGNAAARLQGATAPSSSPPTARSRRSIRRSASARPPRLWEPLDERPADRRRGACRPAAPARRRADHGADADRLGGVRRRPRRTRDARARAAVGDPAPRRGARPEQRPLVGGRGQHVGARAPTSAALAERHVGEQRGVRDARRRRARRSRSPSRCRPSRTAERAILLLAYPKAQALADARKLQLALAVMTLLGLLARRASRRGGRRAGSPSRWRGSTKPPAGLRRASMSRSACAASDELARLADQLQRNGRQDRRARAAHHPARLQRRADRPAQPHHVPAAARASVPRARRQRQPVRAALPRPRPVQGDQRHARPPRRRRPADRGRRSACSRPRAAISSRGSAATSSSCSRRVGEDRNAIDRLARDILDAIAQPLVIDGNEVVPSTSIGIAIAPQDGGDGETLLRNADLALYRAKEAGRGTYAFFEESLNERAQQRRQLETDLRLALERGEFELYYQPLFDLEQNRICSFEALLRWNHPTRGLVSPAEFIPVAEDTGLIVPIGAWVVREACAQAARWPEHVRVAVNVSPVQFHRGALQRNDPARARRQRPRAEPARGRDHRIDLPRRQRGDAAAAPLAARARRPHRARRFRHRLFVAQLFAELPVRQAEDRPQLHPEPADPRRRERDRPRDHRARPCAQHRDHRRRRRGNRAADGAARARLLVGAGLPVRRADDRVRDVEQLFRDDGGAIQNVA